VKIHANSVISTPGAYMTLDVKNCYLNTPMERFKYIWIHIEDIPEEIITEYKLREKGCDGYVWFATSGDFSTTDIGATIECTWVLTEQSCARIVDS
jgi:hypothetical protein